MDPKEIPVLVEISARHIHLTAGDIGVLFGKRYQLKRQKNYLKGRTLPPKKQ
jgi:propanediol utilization protein